MTRHKVSLTFAAAFAIGAFLPSPVPIVGCILAAIFFLGAPLNDACDWIEHRRKMRRWKDWFEQRHR